MPVHIRSLQFYPPTNFLLNIIIPAIGIFQGNTTVFYIVYLYWWHELISSVLDGIFYFLRPQHRDAGYKGPNPLWYRLFLLFIYFIFILVLFGIMSSWNHMHQMGINAEVFLFRNWIFNATLLGILLNELWLRRTHLRPVQFDPFSGRMFVMHISIILGGFVLLAVSKRFPQLFTPHNLWGSVLTATPFLLLKAWQLRQEHQQLSKK